MRTKVYNENLIIQLFKFIKCNPTISKTGLIEAMINMGFASSSRESRNIVKFLKSSDRVEFSISDDSNRNILTNLLSTPEILASKFIEFLKDPKGKDKPKVVVIKEELPKLEDIVYFINDNKIHKGIIVGIRREGLVVGGTDFDEIKNSQIVFEIVPNYGDRIIIKYSNEAFIKKSDLVNNLLKEFKDAEGD